MMMLEIALLLLATLTRLSSALHIPPRSLDIIPELCRTNVSIPSYQEACYSLCQPLHQMQIYCDDSIPCMCPNAPPASMKQCLQCIMDGAGDVLRLIPSYLKGVSSDITAYTNACNSLNFTESGGQHASRELRGAIDDHACRASPIRLISQPIPVHSLENIAINIKLHNHIPFLGILGAVLCLMTLALYR